MWANTREGDERHVRAWLTRAGLGGVFSWVITSTDAGARKPSPRFFAYALARCGCAPDDVLFVGNQLNTDVAGANGVGIRSVWLAGEAYRSDDDRPCDASRPTRSRASSDLPALVRQLVQAELGRDTRRRAGAMAESGRAVRRDSRVVVFETHATSLDNEAGLASGWFDVGLSPRGEQQARELGERRRRDAFAAVYCSDLTRAVRTAELAFGERGIPIVRDARLRECDYGALTRHPAADIEARRASHIAEPFPGGESYEQCVARVSAWLADAERGASRPRRPRHRPPRDVLRARAPAVRNAARAGDRRPVVLAARLDLLGRTALSGAGFAVRRIEGLGFVEKRHVGEILRTADMPSCWLIEVRCCDNTRNVAVRPGERSHGVPMRRRSSPR